jgi:hypothetical protein
MNQNSTVHLTAQQAGYLRSLIATEPSFAALMRSHPDIRIEQDDIGLDRTSADVLRDYFSDRLAIVGFDASYEPNDEGVLLESLIDSLFLLIAQTEVNTAKHSE